MPTQLLDVSATRTARAAATAAFITNGALPATLLARYAEVKQLLQLDDAAFGLIVVGPTIGGALALALPGLLLRRLGTRTTATLGTVWIAAALVLAAAGAAAGQLWLLLAGLALSGLGDTVVDVAQNSQGMRVQEASGVSVLSSMHAGWSIGAAIGGVVGALAASYGVPLVVHLSVWGLVCAVAMLIAASGFLPDRSRPPRQTTPEQATPKGRSGILRLLAPLVLVAIAGISVEEIANNWSAVLLTDRLGVPAAMAGIGLSVTLAAQFLGRLAGDRVVDRLGARRALIVSLSAVVIGLVLAAWSPWLLASLAGLALAGAGCAITVPLAFTRADALPGLPAHSGVTWVVWAMRVTSILLSPAIGAISSVSALPVAISVLAIVPLLALALQLRAARK